MPHLVPQYLEQQYPYADVCWRMLGTSVPGAPVSRGVRLRQNRRLQERGPALYYSTLLLILLYMCPHTLDAAVYRTRSLTLLLIVLYVLYRHLMLPYMCTCYYYICDRILKERLATTVHVSSYSKNEVPHLIVLYFVSTYYYMRLILLILLHLCPQRCPPRRSTSSPLPAYRFFTYFFNFFNFSPIFLSYFLGA